jgi:hypothetical protein
VTCFKIAIFAEYRAANRDPSMGYGRSLESPHGTARCALAARGSALSARWLRILGLAVVNVYAIFAPIGTCCALRLKLTAIRHRPDLVEEIVKTLACEKYSARRSKRQSAKRVRA